MSSRYWTLAPHLAPSIEYTSASKRDYGRSQESTAVTRNYRRSTFPAASCFTMHWVTRLNSWPSTYLCRVARNSAFVRKIRAFFSRWHALAWGAQRFPTRLTREGIAGGRRLMRDLHCYFSVGTDQRWSRSRLGRIHGDGMQPRALPDGAEGAETKRGER